MLTITIPATKGFNDKTNTFIDFKGATICLEHSLVSISKWEAKTHKPFLGKEEKTKEELIFYVKCMTLTQNVDDSAYYFLTEQNFKDINNYIGDPMTATTIKENKLTQSRLNPKEFVTSELIYYWMISLEIPDRFEKWHLNRLLTLIRVCNYKNNPGKPIKGKDLAARNRSINAANRAKFHSKG